MKAAGWVVLAFLASASLLWLPFDDYASAYQTRPAGSVPAGEVTRGFRLAQVVHPPARLRIPAARQPCFAIKFATYARRNRGTLRVDWRQGARSQSWRVDVHGLEDNAFRSFCPDAGFAPNRPYRVGIAGVDGKPGRSATFWLVDDARYGSVEGTPARGAGDKAIALQGTARQRIGPAGIRRVDHGAWVFGWLCTLAIGIVVLRAGLATRPPADTGGRTSA